MPCGESKAEAFHTFGKMSKLQNGLDKGNIIQYIVSASILLNAFEIDFYA